MIVDDLNLFGGAIAPDETNPPLIVDSDRVLSLAVALKRFEPIARRLTQIVQCAAAIEQQQLSTGLPLNGAKTGHVLIRKQARRRCVPERADLSHSLFCLTEYRK
jgi:hypothetical protein